MKSRLLLLMAACVAFSIPTLAKVAAPPTPELFSPADGATNVSLPPILMWNRVEGAANYEWQANRSADLSYPLWSGEETATIDQLQAHSFKYGQVSPGIVVYWRVRALAEDGSTGEWSATWSFTTSSSNQGAQLAAPTLISPPNNEPWVPIPPKLIWQTLDGAIAYEFDANSTTDFSNPQWQGLVSPVEGDEQFYQFSDWEVMPETTVYWFVRGIAADGTPGPWSQRFYFRTSPLMSPALRSPANGATGVALPPVLRWGDVPGAASYEFHANDRNDFSSSPLWHGYIEDTGTGDSGYWFEEGDVSKGTTVYWRVRAVAWNGEPSGWSDVYSFRTQADAPAAPTLSSPYNGAVRVAVPPRLTWLKSDGAASYVLQANTSNSFSAPRWTANVAAASSNEQSHTFAAGDIPNGTQIFWRVRAIGDGGVEGTWSSVFSFTTVAGAPAAPGLVSPVAGANNVSLTPTLVWKKVSGASRYSILVTSGLSVVVGAETNDTGAEEQTYGIPENRLTGGTNYCWKVQAIAADGTGGSYSGSFCFTTEAVLPDFTQPTANSVWSPGSTMTISWTGGNIETIDILASDLSNSNVEYAIVANQSRHSGSIKWTIPSSFSCGRCVVGIRKAGDTAYTFKARLSPVFTVKEGYHLYKPAENGGQVLFMPNKHGWSFSNTADNIFPSSWWNQDQFNYGNIYGAGTDPYTRKKYPSMFAWRAKYPTNASFFPDWPAYVEAFGWTSAYSKLVVGGKSTYNTSFFEFWRTNHISGGFWGGSCSGFASTALVVFHDPGALSVSVGWFDELFAFKPDLNTEPSARQTINARQQYWGGKRQQRHVKRTFSKKPSRTLDDVKAMLATPESTDDGYLYIANYSGAHAVVPYKVDEDPTDTRWTRIWVYDPNSPGNNNLFVRVWIELEIWNYTGFSPQWENVGQGLYLMDPIENYRSNAIVPWSKSASKNGASEDDSLGVMVYAGAGASISIAGQDGSIGYSEGEAFSTIEGAYALIPPVGGPMHPTSYMLPDGNYAVSITDFPDSSAFAAIDAGDVWYTYGRSDARAGQSDVLSLTSGGLTVRSDDGGGKDITLKAVLPDLERTFTVSGITLNRQDSLSLNVADGGTLEVTNMGSVQSYTLELQQSSSDGASTVTRTEVELEAGASHTIAPDWQNLDTAPVPVEIDSNGDGQVDQTIELSMNHVPDAAVITDPAAGASIILAGDPTTPVSVTWEAATDLDGDELTYRWELSETAGFTTILGSMDAGTATTLSTDYGTIGEMLKSAGVPIGASVELYHRVVARDGESETASEALAFTITRGVITAVESKELPAAVVLEQNYPNPFNPATLIRFGLPAASNVRLEVFDMLGRHVRTLIDGQQAAGWHEVVFEAGDLPSGVYMYRLTAGATVSVQRLTLSR